MVDFAISDVERVRELQLDSGGPLLPSDSFIQVAVRRCEENLDFIRNMKLRERIFRIFGTDQENRGVLSSLVESLLVKILVGLTNALRHSV